MFVLEKSEEEPIKLRKNTLQQFTHGGF